MCVVISVLYMKKQGYGVTKSMSRQVVKCASECVT